MHLWVPAWSSFRIKVFNRRVPWGSWFRYNNVKMLFTWGPSKCLLLPPRSTWGSASRSLSSPKPHHSPLAPKITSSSLQLKYLFSTDQIGNCSATRLFERHSIIPAPFLLVWRPKNGKKSGENDQMWSKVSKNMTRDDQKGRWNNRLALE